MQLTVLLILALSQAAYAAPNLVKDGRFAHLGEAVEDISSVQDLQVLAWTSSISLDTEDVFRRTHRNGDVKYIDKFDVYLKKGQMLTQVLSGLTERQKYKMEIQVLANTSCDGPQYLYFGVRESETYTYEIISSEDDEFTTGVFHQMEFRATKTEHEIFVWSDGPNLGNCKGPRLREVRFSLKTL
jgi:hypothetical protein